MCIRSFTPPRVPAAFLCAPCDPPPREEVEVAGDTRPCQACGACCSYSSNWPRFTTEDDAALDLIPEKFVNAKLSGMRCDGERCSALAGKAGVGTACVIA